MPPGTRRRYTPGMDECAWLFGGGSLGAVVGYLARLLLEQRFRKELEADKHALTTLAQRLDFLHQERGKASLALVRLVGTAKMHVKLLVHPAQLGPVDQDEACKNAHAACGQLQNLIAESSFLFPKPVEDSMLRARSALWSILDEATLLYDHAKRRDESPFNTPAFGELWRRLRGEFDPLEAAMIAQIRTLLGAAIDETGR